MRYVPIILGLLVLMLASACVSDRYSTPPHPTWKEREEYCFFFQVDPEGSENNNVGWTDTEPVVESSGTGYTLTAVDARISLYNYSADRHGDARKDWFRASVLWATDAEGVVAVHSRCAILP